MDVQSVVRAFTVIEVLNERSVTTVDTLHQVTGLPKPTLVRILTTLVGMGYVVQVSRRDGYALTERVLRLSAGFSYNDAIIDIARPLMNAFTERHKWQITIATPSSDGMVVRFNTRHISPFGHEKVFLNKQISMLNSALGRAYLTFCSDEERCAILRNIREGEGKACDREERHARALEVIERTRKKGYATLRRPPGNRIRSFAVPVSSSREPDRAIAAIGMFYFELALTETQATNLFLDEVRGIGRQIADALTDLQDAQVARDLVAAPPPVGAHAEWAGGNA